MIKLQMEITKQYFRIHNNNKPMEDNIIDILDMFCRRFEIDTSFNNRKRNKIIDIKRFYSKTYDSFEYRFNIHTLKDFITFINSYGIRPENVKIDRIHPCVPGKFNLFPTTDKTPMDYQIPYIDYLIDSNAPVKLLNLQTGKGKTFISLYSLCKMNKRVLFTTLPRFIEKWKEDILENTNATENDFISISGSSSLINYMLNIMDGDIKPFTMISNRTYINYIKEYENTYYTNKENFSYPLVPDEFISYLSPGNILVDEVHLDFNSFYRIMLYCNVEKLIGLSATLEHMSYDINRMYYYLFPYSYRPDKMEYDRYIDIYRCGYTINDKYRIRYSTYGSNKYSQHEYEQSIIRYKTLLIEYLEMINYYLKKGYINRYKKGDRCLIFAGSVKMCTILTEYLQEKYPNLKISRYVQDDPYENIKESDICVTTVLSGGTAIDIPNLTTVIQTLSVVSIQSNKQSLGRLRKLNNKDTRFYYLYNKRIPPHRYTDKIRRETLSELSRNYKTDDYIKQLGEID